MPQLALTDPDTRYSIFISYVEIYRNYVYDLFDGRPMWKADGRTHNKREREKRRHTHTRTHTQTETCEKDKALE